MKNHTSEAHRPVKQIRSAAVFAYFSRVEYLITWSSTHALHMGGAGRYIHYWPRPTWHFSSRFANCCLPKEAPLGLFSLLQRSSAPTKSLSLEVSHWSLHARLQRLCSRIIALDWLILFLSCVFYCNHHIYAATNCKHTSISRSRTQRRISILFYTEAIQSSFVVLVWCRHFRLCVHFDTATKCLLLLVHSCYSGWVQIEYKQRGFVFSWVLHTFLTTSP